MTTLMAGFLGLVMGQAADEPLYANSQQLSVPFSITPERRAEVRETRLYVSNDKGKSWQLYRTSTPDGTGFNFYAPRDGEYWFRGAAVNLIGKQEPDDIYKVPPASTTRMIIDTLRPIVKLAPAQRQGEEISTSWEITEDHPDPAALVLEYQVQGSPIWVPVEIKAGPTGQTKFRPNSTAAVAVRMTFKDKAGNQTQQLVEAPATVTTAAFAQATVPAPTLPPSTEQGVQTPPPVASPSAPAMPLVNSTIPAFSNVATPVAPPVSPAQDAHVTPPSPDRTFSPVVNPSLTQPAQTPGVAQLNSQPRLVASSENPPNIAPPNVRPVSFAGERKLPSIRYVNSPRVDLQYKVTREGPSGIGSVDLWFTADDGNKWECAPKPVGLDGKTVVEDLIREDGRRVRTVSLDDGDRVYGFTLVVRSRAGLSKGPPKAGDVPQMRIELDTTKPLAKLFNPRPDPGHRDTLMLTWIARDKNLTPNPITLEWSERLESPSWHPIGVDVPNSGQYAWQLPANMPVQVYLRLRVKDLAGNEGIAVTGEPQVVDLTEPEGRLVDISVPQGQ